MAAAAGARSGASDSFEPYATHLLELLKPESDDEIVYRLHMDLRLVQVTEVAYEYGKKGYSLFLVGEDEEVHADPRPSAAASFLTGAFKKFAGLFRRRKGDADATAAAMIEACIWICWADGEVHERERELLFEVIRAVDLSKSERTRLGRKMRRRPAAFDPGERIRSREDKQRCLRLCWQITLSDGLVEAEELAFTQVAGQLGMSEAAVEEIKAEAERELVELTGAAAQAQCES